MISKKIRYYKHKYFPNGSFTSHVLTLMTGTVIAQAIPIAIAPLLTRLYEPNDFGIFAIFSSVMSVLSIISTGRYELAIMLPEDDSDAVNLIAVSLVIASILSFLTLIIVLIFGSNISAAFGKALISTWLYWIPFSILLTGIYQSFYYWYSRKKKFDLLAVSRISQSTAAATTNLSLGLSKYGAEGLIVGGIIGQFSAAAFIVFKFWSDSDKIHKLLSKKSIYKNAIRYREFPLFNSIHALLDSMQTSGIVFAISIFFGNSILGVYSLTLRVLKTPLAIVGSSVTQVFYQKATQAYIDGADLHPLLKKTMVKLFLIALPIFLCMILFAPNLFSIIFGEAWREAGFYAQILSPWIFMNFIVSPVASVYLIVGKQKQALWFSVSDICVKISSIALGVYFGNIIVALFSMTLSGLIILVLGIIWTFKITKNN